MSSHLGAEERLYRLWGEYVDLVSTEEILHWDQETTMPAGGLEGRSQLLSTLAGLRHGKLCAPELLEAIEGCAEEAAPGSVLEAQVAEARWQVERAAKLPVSLAIELAEVQSTGVAAWQEARTRNDFSIFRPFLERMVELKRQQAAALSPDGRAYDALMDEFEPGMKEEALVPLFTHLREALGPLVRAVVEAGKPVDEGAVEGEFPEQLQLAFGKRMAKAIGFDFSAGRLDSSTHPFCVGINRGDVRLTWRSEPGDFRPAVFGILHETGHGLYEQGLPAAWDRTPLGTSVSLGIHESQSRLWENLVGRSKAFWQWALPALHEALPATRKVSVADIWPALHTVKPSLIRVEADEATYNLHVAVRFDLERALFAGDLEVRDLPGAWDETYEKLLGIRAAEPAEGVLQDIHWSLGSFGYFPTYTLGTLAASQLFEAAKKDLGDFDEAFAAGEFQPLLGWMREKIHRYGRRYSATELIEKATGRPLSSEDFLTYLKATTAEVYGVG